MKGIYNSLTLDNKNLAISRCYKQSVSSNPNLRFRLMVYHIYVFIENCRL